VNVTLRPEEACYHLLLVTESGPTVGWLLRAWRSNVAGLGASEAAGQLGVARSAVANWEADRRRPSIAELAGLDAIYGARRALVGLCEAVATPSAFDADGSWWHHFPEGAGQCWAWVRLNRPGCQVRIQARWGPLQIDLRRHCGAKGVIVTLPVSTPEPPVCVTIDPPGWVDFGVGRIPAALPIPSSSVVADIRPVWPPEPAVALFARPLHPLLQLHGGWIDELKRALGIANGSSHPERSHRIEDLSTHPPASPSDPSPRWPGPRYRALRETRAMSRKGAAASVTALCDTQPLTPGQLEVFEQGGQPRVAQLAARLDVIYAADGRTLMSEIEVMERGPGLTLRPPAWWHGPLWIQPYTRQGNDDMSVIGICWGAWEKSVRLRPHAVVSTRKNGGDKTEPTVTLPEGWLLRAGLGRHPAAQPIDYGWRPATTADARRILARHAPAYVRLFNGNVEDLCPPPAPPGTSRPGSRSADPRTSPAPPADGST